jgi:hypothetical protein
MQNATADRPLGALFADLGREASTLVRQEIALAKAEVMNNLSSMGKHVGFVAAGGLVAYAGFIGLMAGLIIVLDRFLPLWLAAFVVGLALAGVGYFLIRQGLDGLKHVEITPRRAVESVKEDVQWARAQMK